MELLRDFAPPVFVGALPLSGALRTPRARSPPRHPQTSLFFFFNVTIGWQLFLFLEGENDPSRLVFLRLGPTWPWTHTKNFAYAPPAKRPSSSQPSIAFPIKLFSAFGVLHSFGMASMKQSLGSPPFPEKGVHMRCWFVLGPHEISGISSHNRSSHALSLVRVMVLFLSASQVVLNM